VTFGLEIMTSSGATSLSVTEHVTSVIADLVVYTASTPVEWEPAQAFISVPGIGPIGFHLILGPTAGPGSNSYDIWAINYCWGELVNDGIRVWSKFNSSLAMRCLILKL
jgi:hypothetical protein